MKGTIEEVRADPICRQGCCMYYLGGVSPANTQPADEEAATGRADVAERDEGGAHASYIYSPLPSH